ncbi:hypothetical protein BP5796_11930 [Coleophoma crateriformis]|uniref:AAA+ ATPase domain-containing protein n=1 Tax=Coleophoma crateriformis TaxID=565419 RepID=A0A3D8QFY4_9HELO|nr:hypothetical protein BP5796_11930 [Coleophoma crateriformis]
MEIGNGPCRNPLSGEEDATRFGPHHTTSVLTSADISQPSADGNDKRDESTDDVENLETMPDGASSQQQETKYEKEKEGENGEARTLDSENPHLTYWCPASGSPHSTYLDGYYDSCPICGQSLARPEFPSAKEQELQVRGSKIVHEVEYRDATNLIIDSIEWGRPFDLEQETNKKSKFQKRTTNTTVFKVVHVLGTSIPGDDTRSISGRRTILDDGIIGNPRVAVSVLNIKLVILSQPLINALQDIATYDTGLELNGGNVTLQEPYLLVAYHISELESFKLNLAKRTQEDSTTTQAANIDGVDKDVVVEHIGYLLDYMHSVFGDSIRQELTRYTDATPSCTYRMIWLLFKPGTTVYVKEEGKVNAYVIDSVDTGDAFLSSPSKVVKIKLWNLDFDGRNITRVRHNVSLEQFDGQQPITSLPVVPGCYWDAEDGGKMRTTLEAEGKKWFKLLSGDQVYYSGELANRKRQTVDGRAYVDPCAYFDETAWPELDRMVPEFTDTNNSTGSLDEIGGAVKGCLCPSCSRRRKITRSEMGISTTVSASKGHLNPPWGQYDNIDTNITKSLELDGSTNPDHRYLLCSRWLGAFMFKTRTWQRLDVTYCQEPKPNRTPFERLVMDEGQKLMIKSLVYKYTDPRFAGSNAQQVWGADFIQNKGDGQIFLLHGGPGVGKTFTAECIAEFTGRPLLALTCGDIGTDEVAMEKSLGKWLTLAHNWGAVMLLDEADVFLETREKADLKRNSLVSVFLRQIEYYQGILFLATNRVGQFDDAFVSRIHVVVHYPDLSREDRQKIWGQFFDKLEDEIGDTVRIDKRARSYVLNSEFEWNGREIRNSFQTAVALAEYRFITKPEVEKNKGDVAVLTSADFEQVCRMTVKFKKYMNTVHGGTEQERAQLSRFRVGPEEDLDNSRAE